MQSSRRGLCNACQNSVCFGAVHGNIDVVRDCDIDVMGFRYRCRCDDGCRVEKGDVASTCRIIDGGVVEKAMDLVIVSVSYNNSQLRLSAYRHRETLRRPGPVTRVMPTCVMKTT